jgi:hypothetical protein
MGCAVYMQEACVLKVAALMLKIKCRIKMDAGTRRLP